MITIIGIDCATQPQKTGLALGCWNGTAVSLQAVTLGHKKELLAHTIVRWFPANQPTLLAIDAPLGWPANMGTQLAQHRAGAPLSGPPNALFRRQTDRLTWQQTGKLPLDVGADRIARTAHAALSLLAELRQITGLPIPLAWQPDLQAGLSAIEVYPAGTLRRLFDPEKVPGYKGKAGRDGRAEILNLLLNLLTLPAEDNLLQHSDDALDAALCVLAGADFLAGLATRPTNLPLAQKEGWIWVRK